MAPSGLPHSEAQPRCASNARKAALQAAFALRAARRAIHGPGCTRNTGILPVFAWRASARFCQAALLAASRAERVGVVGSCSSLPSLFGGGPRERAAAPRRSARVDLL